MKNNKNSLDKTWLYLIQLIVLCAAILFSPFSSAKDRIQYHVQNFDGSTLKVINEQGIVSQSYQYAPFGQQLQLKKPSNLKNPNAFVGGVQDAGDLVYLKQRHYNPVLGRFYQPDQITFISGGHGQTNRYQYGWNDTYSFSDPNGTDSAAFGTLPAQWQQSTEIFWSQLVDKMQTGLEAYGFTGLSIVAPELIFQRLGLSGAAAVGTEPVFTFISKPTTVYRSMYESDYLILQTTGKMPGTSSGTYISPNLAYSSAYSGVLVEFQINARFYDQMLKIATRDSSKAVRQFDEYAGLPVFKNWGNNVHIKSEGYLKDPNGIISIGLGRGQGLDLFNQSVIRFREVTRPK